MPLPVTASCSLSDEDDRNSTRGLLEGNRVNQGSSAGRRLLSLDALRGVTMAAMVIVNNPGDWNTVYWPLLHAEWNGWTPTDLVFPFFLFIMGVSMTLARRELTWSRIVQRGATVIGLGIFMSGFPFFNPSHWRFPGVLVRIGLCYLGSATALRLARRRHGSPTQQAVHLAALTVLLLAGYWIAMTQVSTLWAARGDLTPEGNLGAAVDRALLSGHLYHPRWDPESMFGTFPAIASTLTGVLVGFMLMSSRARKTGVTALCGVISLALGLLWSRSFPINKNLWTSSYVLFTSGAAAVLLAMLYALLDSPGAQSVSLVRKLAQPFVILGTNAIALFVISGLVGKTLMLIKVEGGSGEAVSLQRRIYETWFAPLASPKNASLLYAVVTLILLFALLSFMYRRRIFLKV
jgi:predicted acyltransferase